MGRVRGVLGDELGCIPLNVLPVDPLGLSSWDTACVWDGPWSAGSVRTGSSEQPLGVGGVGRRGGRSRAGSPGQGDKGL